MWGTADPGSTARIAACRSCSPLRRWSRWLPDGAHWRGAKGQHIGCACQQRAGLSAWQRCLLSICDDAVLIETNKYKYVDSLFLTLPPTDPSRAVLVHL